MIQKNDKSDALNLLIYEYLMKNNLGKTASIFKEDANITDFKLSDSEPSLSSLYQNFMETYEVRSGQIIIPDTLNRIEGIMYKLENDKKRYARMSNFRKPRESPNTRKIGEPRGMPFNPRAGPDHQGLAYDPYLSVASQASASSPSFGSTGAPVQGEPYTGPGVLTEIKRIDLGISSILLFYFCPLNNIFILFSSDNRIYFYNLATNEIEYDFAIQGRTITHLKAVESSKSIYFAYSVDEFSINICKYEYMKKEDIKQLDFDIPFKTFCINEESLYILDDNGIKSFTFSGVCTASVKIPNILSIECFGKILILVDSEKISEFDIEQNAELSIITRGGYLTAKVKGEILFVIGKESIQAIDFKSISIAANVKCSVPCKDLTLYNSSIAVSTQSEIFYANQVIPLKNPIGISQFNCLSARGIFAISTDGLIILYSKMHTFE